MKQRKPLILCVDDQPTNLELLEAALASSGYEILKSGSGRDALEKIRTRPIDLIFLDVMMPEMSGFEVCRIIKTDEKLRHIPVVMITALSASEDRIQSMEAGADDFISKPFHRLEVAARAGTLIKAKILNEALQASYENIINLTSYGEQTIQSFEPATFDFESSIKNAFRQMLVEELELSGAPRLILLRMADQNSKYTWQKFEFSSENLIAKPLDFGIEVKLPEKGKFVTFVANQPFDSDLTQFNLTKLGITLESVVGYLSEPICVFAINYGREVTKYDSAVLNSLVMQTLFFKSLSAQISEVEQAFEYTVYALARAAEANDEDTGAHILRVGEYSAILAKELNMPESFVKDIRLQAALHDVGKIHISPEIIKKKGPLTTEEFSVMKAHSYYGSEIIGGHPKLKLAKSIALCHHERYDGGGYPTGLKGEEIPIEARIMNIADQYDALRNLRCYKPAFDHEKTFRILTEGDGRSMPQHFDPKVLEAFRKTAHLFNLIFEKQI